MEYMGNDAYWNEKFQSRGEFCLQADKRLVENIDLLKTGRVLDVACGDGRNALYLLKSGFQVMGIDFSAVGLERLRNFAKGQNLSVRTQQVDLSQSQALEGLGEFDNVVVNHYRLKEDLLAELKNYVTKDGIVLISGFGENHITDDRIKASDLIRKSDFAILETDFEQVKVTESMEENGFIVTYIFKRI